LQVPGKRTCNGIPLGMRNLAGGAGTSHSMLNIPVAKLVNAVAAQQGHRALELAL